MGHRGRHPPFGPPHMLRSMREEAEFSDVVFLEYGVQLTDIFFSLGILKSRKWRSNVLPVSSSDITRGVMVLVSHFPFSLCSLSASSCPFRPYFIDLF